MRREVLEQSSETELEEYARSHGIELAPCKTVEEKIDMILRRRERKTTLTIYGLDLDIPIKSVYDKRVNDILSNPRTTDQEMYVAMEMMLGQAQLQKLIDICTDEDGTVDSHALGLAFGKIVKSDELKNF